MSFKRQMIVKYYRPGEEAVGRVFYHYLLSAEAHPVVGYTVHVTGMNPTPVEGELPAGTMPIRNTANVEEALLGAKARIDSHHSGFRSECQIRHIRIDRKAFDDAQVDPSLGGSDIRKQIDDALDRADPVIVSDPDGGELKVGRDDNGKFTFTPIGNS